MDEKHSEIGSFIRNQREQASMSLRKLADKAGISNPYLSQIERGLRKPSAEILKSLARALSLQAESLYLRAGLLDKTVSGSVIGAIEADERLAAPEKQILIDLYRRMAKEEPTEKEST
jgi:transcriptional regulator with XRE-family HTH domain